MAFRKPLRMRQDKKGKMWAVYFRHPLRGKPIRLPLGLAQGAAKTALDWLNKIFLDKENWRERPVNVPMDVWELWLGGERTIPPPENDADAEAVKWQLRAEHFESEYNKLFERFQAQAKELEHWKGKKVRTGPCPTLQKALEVWIENYKGRDADWTRIVENDLKRFIAEFTPDLEVDEMSGREKDIDTWLRGLDIGAGRRQQMRRIVLRFLDDSGVSIDKRAVASVGKQEVRKDRGQIRWLERVQAEAVAKALPAPWNDYFRIQVAMGFRPDELITLQRANFHGDDFEIVTLAPLKHLTLKQGSRTIRVPEAVRDILERRLDGTEILFPDPATAKPWADPKDYNRAYRKALKAAGTAAGVAFKMDCRIGRRTCASLLLREGLGIERAAAVLGDNPATIREHYAAILPSEVDPSAAALTNNVAKAKTKTRAKKRRALKS